MPSIDIKPRFPLFWQAIYPQHMRELRIPICEICGNLIKVSSYDDIICNSPSTNGDGQCGGTDVSFSVSDGAVVVPLRFGILHEFDEEGAAPLNFRYLPTDGLQAFGLIDPLISPPTMYMINLNTGNIEVGNVEAGTTIPLAVGIEFPTRGGADVVPISMVLERYGSGGDLIHYKHCEEYAFLRMQSDDDVIVGGFAMDHGTPKIVSIVAGYKCRIPGWACQVKINVDCSTHIPFITTKANRIDEVSTTHD